MLFPQELIQAWYALRKQQAGGCFNACSGPETRRRAAAG